MTTHATTTADFTIRPAREEDLPALARFEVEIARISFSDNAVEDPEVHHRKLHKAMRRDPEGMFVAAREGEEPIGWLWMALNTNSFTGDRYVNFRSLATADVPQRSAVAEALLETGLDFARRNEVTRVVGKVHVGNVPMRTLYHKYGFQATHLTMELTTDGSAD